MPGLERLPELQLDALVFDLAAEREAELRLRLVPFGPEHEAMVREVAEHVEEILPEEMRQHEAVVQCGAPAHEIALQRRLPEARDQCPEQHLLREAHAGVRRHLEAAKLDEAEATRRSVGREQLVDADLGTVRIAGHVDEQVAEQPVDEPGGRGLAVARRRDLRQRDLQFVERVVARLVDAGRLARGPMKRPANR